MKDRLFITGLALGLDNESCLCGNYNIDWLFRYPSTLLWADKIVVTEKIWKIITDGKYSPSVSNEKENEFAKAIKLIFEILHSYDLIEIVDVSGVIEQQLEDEIYLSIQKDVDNLTRYYPDRVKTDKDCNFIEIDGFHYCIPHIWTIYASLVYSRYFNSNCLSDPGELNYLQYKLNFGANRIPELNKKVEVFQNVLEINLPNEPIGHIYLYDNAKQCFTCEHEVKCKDTYLNEIEKNVKKILDKREYDEIHQLTQTLDQIYTIRQNADIEYIARDVLNDFNEKKKQINKNIKSVFPKVRRWSNLTTFVSIPIALAGLITGKPELTIPGASVAALGKGAEEMLNYMESKFKWINFINKD